MVRVRVNVVRVRVRLRVSVRVRGRVSIDGRVGRLSGQRFCFEQGQAARIIPVIQPTLTQVKKYSYKIENVVVLGFVRLLQGLRPGHVFPLETVKGLSSCLGVEYKTDAWARINRVNACTHASTHARTHARTHERTHARTHASMRL